jgi:hypothetical protein
MKTRLHHYSFTLPKDKAAYEEMAHEIEANGPEGRGRQMHSIADRFDHSKAGTVEDVELDPSCLFENQWNETTESGNRRLFDWFEEAVFTNGRERKDVRRGHWLEITAEMTAARSDTRKCGYCGKHYGPFHEKAPGEFCTACLDSPYLKDSELHLLRLLPLVGLQTREELTDDERAALLPAYIDRQTTGADSRAKQRRDKQRADVLKEYAKDTKNATTERDGKLWLWDRGFDLDNVIYYSHTGKFSFGWRQPVSDAVASKLLDVISEFPFPYTIISESKTYEAA